MTQVGTDIVDSDIQGRPYLKLKDAKDGLVVWLDGCFPCHKPGSVILNKEDPLDILDAYIFSFECREGKHYIDGQCDDGIHCIGIYPDDPGEMKWENKDE